jgi:ParB family chromosome partitioning protein
LKSSAKKIELASVDDLFSTEESRQDATLERVQIIPLSELHPFPDHPFSVRDDDDIMKETLDSVKARGILTPAIARPREDGGYELVAGHRRKRACELAGLDAMPVIVRDLDRDEAGISKDQVRRYVRLTELSPELQKMVDDKKIAMTPAVEISYLKPEEQALLVETMESEQATPSLSQAQRMKRMSQEGKLTEDTMLSVMSEQKKPEVDRIVFTSDTLRKYFPKSYTPKKMEETIINLLEGWMKKRQRGQER